MTSSEYAAWIQAAAAVLQGAAAVAVWVITLRLVRVTRDMVYAPIDPDVRLEIPVAGMDDASEEPATLVNAGACDIVDLEVWAYAAVRTSGPTVMEDGEQAFRLDRLPVPGNLVSLQRAEFAVLGMMRRAIETANTLRLGENRRISFKGVNFEIDCRQGITRKATHCVDKYQIYQWPDGKLSLLPLGRVQLDRTQYRHATAAPSGSGPDRLPAYPASYP